MGPRSRLRPALESLDGRLLLSQASPHAAAARVSTVHLHGPAPDVATLSGDATPGRPRTFRVVADRANVVNVSVQSVGGGHLSVRLGGANATKDYMGFTTSSNAGPASTAGDAPGSGGIGNLSARTMTIVVRVAGVGHYDLTITAMKVSKNLHLPGPTPPPVASSGQSHRP